MRKNEIRKIIINNEVLTYELTRKRVKNINLRIKVDGTIIVSASEKISTKKIEDFIVSRGDNIEKHLNKFAKMRGRTPTAGRPLTEEEYYLLGKIVRVKISQSNIESICTDGEYLYLKMRDIEDEERKEKIIAHFFEKFTKDYLSKIVKELYPTFEKYGVPYPHLKLRDMKSRWGSCMPYKQQINLNKKLIKVPQECIEYVVLHEYAHFIHLNHSKEFYNLVGLLMPDYQERKKKLSGFGAEVL